MHVVLKNVLYNLNNRVIKIFCGSIKHFTFYNIFMCTAKSLTNGLTTKQVHTFKVHNGNIYNNIANKAIHSSTPFDAYQFLIKICTR